MKQNPKDIIEAEILGEIKSTHSDSQRIKSVAVIGIGVMGRGIVQAIAQAGFDVIAVEKDEQSLHSARGKLEEALDYEIQRWAMTKSEKKSILSRIEWTTNIEDVKECELVIEAVDEDFELKKAIFKKLDEICPPHTIFVSNTSTLSLTKISEATKRSDKIIGMHFLNPVPKIPLVELVRALKTSDDTFKKVKTFAEHIGKTVVEVYEYPGFVTTRVILPMLNEAMHVLMEGISTAEGIDTAMKLGYNFQMGPLEMADTMGLDEVLTWMETLYKELGEKYRPCPLLRKLVREGKLGKKTGEGFFKYDEFGRKIS